MSEHDIDASRAPLFEPRLRNSVIALIVGFGICFYFADQIFNVLLGPLETAVGSRSDEKPIFTTLKELFFIQLKLGLFGALFLVFPLLACQVVVFAVRKFSPNARRVSWLYLVTPSALFLIGTACAYFLFVPLAISAYTELDAVEEQWRAVTYARMASGYLDESIPLILASGLGFQSPLVVFLFLNGRRTEVALETSDIERPELEESTLMPRSTEG